MSLLNKASFLVTPNGYKEDKLYAAIPTTGDGDMTFTRATTATRVNEAGLVELVPYNLIRYSEQFDNAAWLQYPLATVTVTPNVEIAPDGTLTADLINMPISRSIFQNFSIPAGEAATASVYIKGTAGETINFAVKGGNSTKVLTGEWQRIEHTSSSSSTVFSVNRYSGGTASSFYLWGYQVVEGTSALTYQKTVDRLDIPRIDYTGGGCPSILLEPLRTNLALYSEDFNDASWAKTNTTISANATTAPDGTTTADKVIATATTGAHSVSQVCSVSASTTYTGSVYVKASEYTKVYFRAGSGIAAAMTVDLTTETVITTYGTLSNAFVTPVADGWFRIGFTQTTAVSIPNWAPNIMGYPDAGATIDFSAVTYTGDGTSGIYIWGAQLEAGAYPTSYIPTTTGTVTRNADAISKTGISDLLNPSEGTFYAEISALANDLTNRMLSLSDGTGDNTVQIRFSNASNQIRLDIYGQSAVYRSLVTVLDITENHKVLIKWGASGIFGFIDGDKYTFFLAIGTGSGIPTALNRINFNNWSGAAAFYGKCKGVQIYKTALSDPQCKALTTL